jgi:hypothetical protein
MSVTDRLKELLPLLLVGVILLVFYLTRAQGPALSFPPLSAASPTSAAVAPLEPAAVRQQSATSPATFCNPMRPRFVGRMVSLRAALGASMGDALECEQAVDAEGNTHQTTARGLAYYRAQTDVACFTTGWDHWAMRADGRVVRWAGEAVDPPPEATLISR